LRPEYEEPKRKRAELRFEAVETAEFTTWHLLLEELTESHFFPTEWPLLPALAQCEIIVQALVSRRMVGRSASAHIRGGLGQRRGIRPELANFCKKVCTVHGSIQRACSSRARRELYERLLDQAPRLLAR